MWLMILTGTVVGLGVGAMLGSMGRRRKPLPIAIVGAVAGALLAYTYASGGASFPEIASAEQFDQQVLQAEGPVLVDFYMDGCVPCRQLAPRLNSLSQEYAGRVEFRKVNVGHAVELGRRYEIRGVPTVMLFDRGETLYRWVGLQSKEAYREALDEVAGAQVN